jgi:nucleoside-diphosphate-sugar epimerase
VRRVIAVDRTQPARLFVEPRVEYVRADLASPRLLQAVMGIATDSVFHAWDRGDGAGGEHQAPSFALVDSLRELFAACALQSARPKVVLASSYAVEQAPGAREGALPASQDGLTALVGELLLAETARQSGLDGHALRLALIAGAPGCASFLRELVRALRDGHPAHCPIPLETPLWLTSAPAAARALVHAHELPPAAWAESGALNAPARSLSVDALVQAVGRLGGHAVEPIVEADPALCDELARRALRAAIDTSLTLGFEDGPDADALVGDLLAAPDQ